MMCRGGIWFQCASTVWRVGLPSRAKSSCGLLYNIGYGHQTEGTDTDCKSKALLAFFVSRRKTRWNTFSCNVFMQDKYGSFALGDWALILSSRPPLIIASETGGWTQGSAYTRETAKDSMLFARLSAGTYGSRGTIECSATPPLPPNGK